MVRMPQSISLLERTEHKAIYLTFGGPEMENIRIRAKHSAQVNEIKQTTLRKRTT